MMDKVLVATCAVPLIAGIGAIVLTMSIVEQRNRSNACEARGGVYVEAKDRFVCLDRRALIDVSGP